MRVEFASTSRNALSTAVRSRFQKPPRMLQEGSEYDISIPPAKAGAGSIRPTGECDYVRLTDSRRSRPGEPRWPNSFLQLDTSAERGFSVPRAGPTRVPPLPRAVTVASPFWTSPRKCPDWG